MDLKRCLSLILCYAANPLECKCFASLVYLQRIALLLLALYTMWQIGKNSWNPIKQFYAVCIIQLKRLKNRSIFCIALIFLAAVFLTNFPSVVHSCLCFSLCYSKDTLIKKERSFWENFLEQWNEFFPLASLPSSWSYEELSLNDSLVIFWALCNSLPVFAKVAFGRKKTLQAMAGRKLGCNSW